MSKKYTLHYFDGRGRGELIRLLFAMKDMSFEDDRIKFEDWPKLKARTPSGQLPYMVIGDKAFGQSIALARFFAKEFGLYGKDNLSQLGIDEILDDVVDFRNFNVKIMFEPDAEKKAELQKKLEEVTGPAFMKKMGKILSDNKTGFLVGNACTVADVALFDIMNGMAMNPDAEKTFSTAPNVKAHMEKIQAIPGIKAWLDKRPTTQF
ncbi:glutathione S-transferase 1-like [Ylistrum balloti]|uniref:glutathione S-transferase 1-like n=1 Tax=Ylistrum balloti TaxID=509963 RepID=UPI002905E850|nr:glutathione S-transferase 1-like [Ylistrum balloti]